MVVQGHIKDTRHSNRATAIKLNRWLVLDCLIDWLVGFSAWLPGEQTLQSTNQCQFAALSKLITSELFTPLQRPAHSSDATTNALHNPCLYYSFMLTAWVQTIGTMSNWKPTVTPYCYQFCSFDIIHSWPNSRHHKRHAKCLSHSEQSVTYPI